MQKQNVDKYYYFVVSWVTCRKFQVSYMYVRQTAPVNVDSVTL